MAHDAFLRAIVASPDDDLPRLVYADYLEETGDSVRAEFIRVQCELARLAEADPKRNSLEDREHELLNEHEPEFLGDLDAHEQLQLREWKFRRGFLSDVTMNALSLDTLGSRLARRHPITGWTYQNQLGLTDFMDPSELLGSPGFAGIRRVDLSGSYDNNLNFESLFANEKTPPLEALDLSKLFDTAPLLASLARSPLAASIKSLSLGAWTERPGDWQGDVPLEIVDRQLESVLERMRLVHLDLGDSSLNDSAVARIFAAPTAVGLKDLDLSYNPTSGDVWQSFRTADSTMRLKTLNLANTSVAHSHLEPLLASPVLADLTDLDISNCSSTRENVEILVDSAYWQHARRLWTSVGKITADALEPLVQSPGPSGLRVLDLSHNELRTEGVRRLAESAWAGSLTWLGLTNNTLDDEAARVLGHSGAFAQLRTLHLAQNWGDRRYPGSGLLTNRAAVYLANAPSLANLQVLTVSHAAMTEAGIEALLNGPHWRLSGLGLSAVELSEASVAILANSPRLARLQWLDLSRNRGLEGSALKVLAESPYLSRLCELDIGYIGVDDATRDRLRDRLGHRLSE